MQLIPVYFFAQTTEQLSSSEILQGIEKLRSVGSVLYIAAHPDDENTRLLTYLSRELKLRTAYLSITRGDGGQNLVGKEQAELLGIIRTQELLAARRIDGAEQFFTRANDFGYSKSAEETFHFWRKDTILSDMVWIIRNFKPDIIICRFPSTGEGGHGHHTASAILAMEAFEAAADPTRFPWQLKFIQTWETKRIFWNVFNSGSINTASTEQLQIDVGGFNALLGKSYGEIAAESRSMHKSQGFGSARMRGSQIEYFKFLKGDSVNDDLFSGINLDWMRFGNPGDINGKINECIQNYDATDPAKSIPALIKIYDALRTMSPKDSEMNQCIQRKLKETKSLIVDCAGLWLEATADSYAGIPGRNIDIAIQAINRSNAHVNLKRIAFSASSDTIAVMPLLKNVVNTFRRTITLDKDIPYSNPYWLNQPHHEGFFSVDNPEQLLRPENQPAYTVFFELEIDGRHFEIERPLVYKYSDPVKGEIYRPFEILPPVAINFSSKAFVFEKGAASKILLRLDALSDCEGGKILLSIPSGWKSEPARFAFGSMKKNDEQIFEATITAPAGISDGKISAIVQLKADTVSLSIKRIEYDHIPYQFMLTDANAQLRSIDIKSAAKNIGYIPGAGDEVAECLSQLGFHVTILTENEMSKADLNSFDAIVTGIRAYNTNEWLQKYNQPLLQYMNQGGNFIVQYNTNNRIGPLISKISPYPFTISRERVTNENAEVNFLDRSHSALNFPNKISEEDFKGWRQERGIYFATEVDTAFSKILAMNDPGEKPSDGSLIIAPYGRGNFVYTGLVFFRELPAAVPGAYRLFVNLLSLPKHN